MTGQILRLPMAHRRSRSTAVASCLPEHVMFRDANAAWLWTSTENDRRAFCSLPAIRSAILGGLARDCHRHLIGEMAAVHRELAVLVQDMGRADRSRSRRLRGVAGGIAQDLARLEADLASIEPGACRDHVAPGSTRQACDHQGNDGTLSWLGSAAPPGRMTFPPSAAGETTALLLSTFRQAAEVLGFRGLAATLSVCRATLCVLSRRLVLATQVRWASCAPDGLGYWIALQGTCRANDRASPRSLALPAPLGACRMLQATLAQTRLIYAVMGLAFSRALAFEELEGDRAGPVGRV